MQNASNAVGNWGGFWRTHINPSNRPLSVYRSHNTDECKHSFRQCMIFAGSQLSSRDTLPGRCTDDCSRRAESCRVCTCRDPQTWHPAVGARVAHRCISHRDGRRHCDRPDLGSTRETASRTTETTPRCQNTPFPIFCSLYHINIISIRMIVHCNRSLLAKMPFSSICNQSSILEIFHLS